MKRSRNKCIAFWRTKCKIELDSFTEVVPILATLLKMVEDDGRILTWGRCKGVIVCGKFQYNGFLILDDVDNVEDIIVKFKEYVEFTSNHEFTDTTESKEILRLYLEEMKETE